MTCRCRQEQGASQAGASSSASHPEPAHAAAQLSEQALVLKHCQIFVADAPNRWARSLRAYTQGQIRTMLLRPAL
jgi:hypothetical protein